MIISLPDLVACRLIPSTTKYLSYKNYSAPILLGMGSVLLQKHKTHSEGKYLSFMQEHIFQWARLQWKHNNVHICHFSYRFSVLFISTPCLQVVVSQNKSVSVWYDVFLHHFHRDHAIGGASRISNSFHPIISNAPIFSRKQLIMIFN